MSWGRNSSLTRVKIEPLSQEAVAELAGPRDIDAEELYRVTGGNPFFVTEVLAGEGQIRSRSATRSSRGRAV